MSRMFLDLPLDPAARAERRRQQERDELVALRDRLRPKSTSSTTETLCYAAGAFCLVSCAFLTILMFVLIAKDGGALVQAIIDLMPSAANVTFNFTLNETA